MRAFYGALLRRQALVGSVSAASSGDKASTPASSNVVPSFGSGRKARDKWRRTARARQKATEARIAGALNVERHLVVFLSPRRSATKPQAPNLTLDFPVPSSQKKMTKTMQSNKNMLMCVPYVIVLAYGSISVLPFLTQFAVKSVFVCHLLKCDFTTKISRTQNDYRCVGVHSTSNI